MAFDLLVCARIGCDLVLVGGLWYAFSSRRGTRVYNLSAVLAVFQTVQKEILISQSTMAESCGFRMTRI
jgi:hypothetical protein